LIILGHQKWKCPFAEENIPVLIYDFDIHIEATQILYKILAAVIYK
jgi:hypothetical protein